MYTINATETERKTSDLTVVGFRYITIMTTTKPVFGIKKKNNNNYYYAFCTNIILCVKNVYNTSEYMCGLYNIKNEKTTLMLYYCRMFGDTINIRYYINKLYTARQCTK